VNERGGIDVAGKKYKVEIVYYDDESNCEHLGSSSTRS
jgi:hypothetical protein